MRAFEKGTSFVSTQRNFLLKQASGTKKNLGILWLAFQMSEEKIRNIKISSNAKKYAKREGGKGMISI